MYVRRKIDVKFKRPAKGCFGSFKQEKALVCSCCGCCQFSFLTQMTSTQQSWPWSSSTVQYWTDSIIMIGDSTVAELASNGTLMAQV